MASASGFCIGDCRDVPQHVAIPNFFIDECHIRNMGCDAFAVWTCIKRWAWSRPGYQSYRSLACLTGMSQSHAVKCVEQLQSLGYIRHVGFGEIGTKGECTKTYDIMPPSAGLLKAEMLPALAKINRRLADELSAKIASSTDEAQSTALQERDETKQEPQTPLPGFDRFWAAWPSHVRKNNRGECRRIWQKRELEALAQPILTALVAFKSCKQWTDQDGQFIPKPETWLNQRRWETPLASLVQKVQDESDDWKPRKATAEVMDELFGPSLDDGANEGDLP